MLFVYKFNKKKLMVHSMKKLIINLCLLLVSTQTFALSSADVPSSYWEKFFIERDLKEHSDLTFTPPTVYNNNFDYVNKIFVPNGSGPFPVVVVLPDCGGVDTHYRKIMEQALQNGYASIVLDTHRGAKSNCFPPPQRPVKYGRMVKDSYDLAAYLATLPVINKNRIYSIGGSEGGMISGFLASAGIQKFTAPNSPRYRANVSLYGCGIYPKGTFRNQTAHTPYFFNDTDKPLLWLMGGADTECLVNDEIEVLKDLQSKQVPVEFHVYTDATHCWICESKNGHTKNLTYGGNSVSVTYKFDEKIRSDSISRAFSFFEKHK
jgi:dienelactone hydrolase